MRDWVVEYAYRCDGNYVEKRMYVKAEFLDEAYNVAHAKINEMAVNNVWSCYMIWDIGLIADADEEVC